MSGPTYTYTANTPNSSDPMNTTQSLILNNFQAINELIGVNHVGFNSTDSGKHNLLSLEYQSTLPTTASTDINVFCQQTPSGPNAAELFYIDTVGGSPQQLTNVNTPTTSSSLYPAGTSGTGWCKFADSGIIMKWGTATVTIVPQFTGVSNEVTFFYLPTGSGIPAYTLAIFYCTINLLNNSSGSNPFSGIGSSAFYGGNRVTTYITLEQVSTSPITITFNWFTIGV
jgi:hypothetical protein